MLEQIQERTFYAKAMKSGETLQMHIERDAQKKLGLEPGDEVEVTIRKTGFKGRIRVNAFGRESRKVASPTSIPASAEAGQVSNSPEAPESQNYSVVPEHVIERVFLAKAKGVHLDQLKSAFNETTDYQWADIPEKVRKELEA